MHCLLCQSFSKIMNELIHYHVRSFPAYERLVGRHFFFFNILWSVSFLWTHYTTCMSFSKSSPCFKEPALQYFSDSWTCTCLQWQVKGWRLKYQRPPLKKGQHELRHDTIKFTEYKHLVISLEKKETVKCFKEVTKNMDVH